ncbi:hypothetical protein IEQ34_012009 [Dendrobium chrysotoxum]|uniref:Pentatricopeptide repeat-containing protein n=1 Tax=Dendrobium chrysotoxum TaxID=161865 RepID=A0AAV7GBR0_DENCH|nr:hypothetical protein IEQ34_012009 [Dendrobium chrysotoxum]
MTWIRPFRGIRPTVDPIPRVVALSGSIRAVDQFQRRSDSHGGRLHGQVIATSATMIAAVIALSHSPEVMRALGRAANLARIHDACIMVALASCASNPVASIYNLGHSNAESWTHHQDYGLCVYTKKFFFGPFSTIRSNLMYRTLSSQAGDLTIHMLDEQGFSDSNATFDHNKNGSIVDGMDIGQLVQEELPEIDSKASSIEPVEKRSRDRDVASPLVMALMKAPYNSISITLNDWVQHGNTLDRSEISVAMIYLRRRRLYDKALQFVEWLESTKRLNFVERDYASHLDLVAKTDGLHKAETYIHKVPETFRGEVVYRTLLANCVAAGNVEKAEQVFSRMRDLGFSISSFAYNQLLLLYRRIDRRKIPDVLLMMEKDSIKPSLFTYMILIDAKGLSKDIAGVQKIVESMKAEGVVPDNALRAMVARHYISAGCNEKAEAILKEMEDDCVRENSDAWRFLLPLYASLRKVDDVRRMWKSCEASACIDDFTSAIEAWGKLGFVDDAENIFQKMTKKWKKIPPRSYNALLKVYADHKLVSKGKDLARKMSDDGCWIGPLTWDALVKLFAEAGEVEKADSVLQNAAARPTGSRPLYSSYITVLDKYAEVGNVHHAEKIFHRLRQAKYPSRVNQYLLLAKAYKNAKTPAYGLRERMKADNVYPDKKFLAELVALENF